MAQRGSESAEWVSALAAGLLTLTAIRSFLGVGWNHAFRNADNVRRQDAFGDAMRIRGKRGGISLDRRLCSLIDDTFQPFGCSDQCVVYVRQRGPACLPSIPLCHSAKLVIRKARQKG